MLCAVSFILLNIRPLKRNAIDIAYDKKLIANDFLFLTETQVSQAGELSAMQSILEEYTLDHSTILVSYHQKNALSKHSGRVINVVLMHRKVSYRICKFYPIIVLI